MNYDGLRDLQVHTALTIESVFDEYLFEVRNHNAAFSRSTLAQLLEEAFRDERITVYPV